MAASTDTQDDGIVGINVTPLVDITLVLLIIFMVTAKLVVSQAMPHDLPRIAHGEVTQTMLVLTIDAQGALEIEGRKIRDDAALRDAARLALARNKELRTVIHASRAATHGTVIHVLDVLRGEGVTRVAFGAEKLP